VAKIAVGDRWQNCIALHRFPARGGAYEFRGGGWRYGVEKRLRFRSIVLISTILGYWYIVASKKLVWLLMY